MRRPVLAAITSAAALVLSSVALASSAGAAPSSTGVHHRNDRVCSSPARGHAACDAVRQDTVDAAGHLVATASPDRARTSAVMPAGLGPAQLRDAYNLTAASSGGKTVAVVDAYDAPSAASDLNTYRSRFGLPACTVASGCFTKINQFGSKTGLPAANGGWAQEIALDLDMVSAACPDCKILLVEARSDSFSDLAAAVRKAASRAGVVAISNSYGGTDTGNTTLAKAYNQPGKAVTASTGDTGYGAQIPATFPGVVAVGGTALKRNTKVARGWTETAWSGAGSGCSLFNPKPGYQTAATRCGKKAEADVSAVGDPNTGVAVYDSYAYQGSSGWMVFGGTSASSPFIAAVYAQGRALTSGSTAGAYTWHHPSALFDVTSGSNGSCPTYVWCHARSGWDGPTGLGTPNGTGAF